MMLLMFAGLVIAGFVMWLEASRWGLPRITRKERLHCPLYPCNASFVWHRDGHPDPGHPKRPGTIQMLALHEAAAHAPEDSPQLWPWALPVRTRDFSTRQARVVQDTIRESDVMIVGGYRVIRGGKASGK